MIALDDKKVPKVWLNFNFARNSGVYYNKQEQNKDSEATMVRSVYRVVEGHLKPHPLSVRLRNII